MMFCGGKEGFARKQPDLLGRFFRIGRLQRSVESIESSFEFSCHVRDSYSGVLLAPFIPAVKGNRNVLGVNIQHFQGRRRDSSDLYP